MSHIDLVGGGGGGGGGCATATDVLQPEPMLMSVVKRTEAAAGRADAKVPGRLVLEEGAQDGRGRQVR